jgi:hypothetical protein
VGGVYQWERIEDAKAFYTGPSLEEVKVELFEETVASKCP